MSTAKVEKKATRVIQKDEGWIMPLVGGPKLRVSKFFRLAYLSARVEDVIKRYKPKALADLLVIWCQRYFEKKVKPIKSWVRFDRKDVDMEATFVVSFNGNLNSLVKEKEVVKSGLTPTQFLAKTITEAGVPAKAAVAFVANEVEIVDKTNLSASLNDLRNSDDKATRSFATKLIAHLRSGAFSDEELAAGLEVCQSVELKRDVLDRLLNYCQSVDEMTSLLTVCKQGTKVQECKVGESLPAATQIEQMSATVAEFVTGE
jgi:hypothetical protein